jgi:hypothetical protein
LSAHGKQHTKEASEHQRPGLRLGDRSERRPRLIPQIVTGDFYGDSALRTGISSYFLFIA